jgi:hypothetical protein
VVYVALVVGVGGCVGGVVCGGDVCGEVCGGEVCGVVTLAPPVGGGTATVESELLLFEELRDLR